MDTKNAVPAVIPAPKDLAQHLTLKQVSEVLQHIPMSPELAATAFTWARDGAKYLRGSAQSSVNMDFDEEYKNSRLKGVDADGSAVAVSVKTRKAFEKLDSALERAAKAATSIIETEVVK